MNSAIIKLMALILEILDGAMQGTQVMARARLTIGRRDCDVTIKDSKLSSKHAAIESRAEGELWLIDSGSANGIKVDGRRVRELRLDPGRQFIVGRTTFSVREQSEALVEDPNRPESAPHDPFVAPTPTVWDKLMTLIDRAASEDVSPIEIQPFSPPLKLKFEGGIQTGVEWIVGYGPREVGAHAVDLALEEVAAEPLCFRLSPQQNKVWLKRLSNHDLFLNGVAVDESFLEEGDVIEIHHTRIKVSFDENK